MAKSEQDRIEEMNMLKGLIEEHEQLRDEYKEKEQEAHRGSREARAMVAELERERSKQRRGAFRHNAIAHNLREALEGIERTNKLAEVESDDDEEDEDDD